MRRDWLAPVLLLVGALLLAVMVAAPSTAQRGQKRGISQAARFTITADTSVCLSEEAPGAFRAWSCRGPVAGTVPFYVVNSTNETDATEGDGPFCDGASCNGNIAGNETSDACLFASGSDVELSCHFEME